LFNFIELLLQLLYNIDTILLLGVDIVQNKTIKRAICAILGSLLTISSITSASAVTDDAKMLCHYEIIDGRAILVRDKKIETVKNSDRYGLIKSDKLPTSYNLADEGGITDVKDQNPYGTLVIL